MRINQYSVSLNSDKSIQLVKEKATNYTMSVCDSPSKVASLLNGLFDLSNRAEEYAFLVCLDTKNKVLGVFEVSHGTVNSSFLNPREVLIRCLLCGATNFIVAHNHPSGDVTPSKEDNKMFERMCSAGNVVGIKCLDSVIVGSDEYGPHFHSSKEYL